MIIRSRLHQSPAGGANFLCHSSATLTDSPAPLNARPTSIAPWFIPAYIRKKP
ncbi:hypothetical protein [Arundinibacter roseus]|uniref:hypothetical protein n=1 Tax=Arundinibacter roseus TaxID=2070510 RepID=UPI0014046ACE|nr:hypothetical protein [Arundinibacter roseus]